MRDGAVPGACGATGGRDRGGASGDAAAGRASGRAGSSGTWTAPAVRTPSRAATESAERGRRTA
ncbi:hypothetical protein ACWGCP_34695, partial [Streptomyces niveus]